jgi:processive 1,2-diacylglycerol beta-glucosyltransferase
VILILTAGFGDGHNSAARNVARALQCLAPDLPTRMVDVFDMAHPLLSPAMKTGYQMLITHLPWAWKRIYSGAATIKFEPGALDSLVLMRRALDQLVRTLRPQAIISTYPIYAQLMKQLPMPEAERPPLFTVVTDSITVHPVWSLGCNASSSYFVADAESKSALVKLGVPAERVMVTGFPVSLDFMPAPGAQPPERRGILYLPSTSTGHVRATLEALRPLIVSGARLTLPLGKHLPRLYQSVTRFVDSLPDSHFEVLGWTNQMPHLLQTHEVVICKAGGAILHEALAARCPAIIDYIVPGQEEGNAELLTSHACGVVSKSAEETASLLGKLLADGGGRLKVMRENARSLCEPGAALRIAEHVLRSLRG